MTAPLLATKLYIPSIRPELVSRPRLVECLNVGLDRKLTLISAPGRLWQNRAVEQMVWVSILWTDNDRQ